MKVARSVVEIDSDDSYDDSVDNSDDDDSDDDERGRA
jgi:hypothetical protein